jgi:hypothetical protein
VESFSPVGVDVTLDVGEDVVLIVEFENSVPVVEVLMLLELVISADVLDVETLLLDVEMLLLDVLVEIVVRVDASNVIIPSVTGPWVP